MLPFFSLSILLLIYLLNPPMHNIEAKRSLPAYMHLLECWLYFKKPMTNFSRCYNGMLLLGIFLHLYHPSFPHYNDSLFINIHLWVAINMLLATPGHACLIWLHICMHMPSPLLKIFSVWHYNYFLSGTVVCRYSYLKSIFVVGSRWKSQLWTLLTSIVATMVWFCFHRF